MAVAIKPQYVYMRPHKALEDFGTFCYVAQPVPRGRVRPLFTFDFAWQKAGSAKAYFAAVYRRG